jgi:transposase
VSALKEASASFIAMRRLAMRFRGLLQGVNPSKLDRFLHDARRSRLSSMQQFARTLTRDIETVKHAIAEPWSSGQAEGQINRLKTLKARHVRPREYRALASTDASTSTRAN